MTDLNDVEKQLRQLAQMKSNPDPTPIWKEDILRHALAVGQSRPATLLLPPRALVIGWAASAYISVVLHFLTPAPPHTSSSVAAHPLSSGSVQAPTLLALQLQYQRNPDFP